MFKRIISGLLIWVCFSYGNFLVYAQETKYPDYSYEFIGEDKLENYNRKMFNFNLGLNKYLIRPVHILWASIMPEYGMNRIQGITNNIEYPIRLVSSLIQRDFNTSKNETIRFFTNTILGLGGMYNPAKHLFKLEQSQENMEQAFAKCKMKSGPYFVLPVLSFVNTRGLLGKAFDVALNPGSYIATPLLAIIKACLTVNKTSYLQPVIKMVESTYADPYEIAKKIFGLDTYIKVENLDRLALPDLILPKKELVHKEDSKPADIKKASVEKAKESNIVKTEVFSEIVLPDVIKGGTNFDEIIKDFSTENFKLGADMFLLDYNPQHPVVDSMRTALFSIPGVDESVWNELSVWNRSFSKRIKTDSVNVVQNRENYSFRYILQKDKSAPVVIIYPSIGEGISSGHSVLLGKIFYDEGYSVVIQGSHFQWEFVKSMPAGYRPGLPSKDAELLRLLTLKILNSLQEKYHCEFGEKVIIGTSFGALTSLFVAEKEMKDNTLGDTKYISICPPVELIYAMKQIDKVSEDWNKSSEDLKKRVAMTAAKVLKLSEMEDSVKSEVNYLPFSEDEAKLITGFIMHQKLSDLIFTLENAPKSQKSDIYYMINNMNYKDYAEKYLLAQPQETVDDLSYEVSLYAISNYLELADNYKIYHSLTDYLTNTNQLKKLKQYSQDKVVLIDNGAHLGFLYREEFIKDLKETISSFKTKALVSKSY